MEIPNREFYKSKYEYLKGFINNGKIPNFFLLYGIKNNPSFEFNDFPMLGIWTPNHVHANFICIEPWIGCADPSDHDNVFTNKRYLINLNPNDEKLISYHIKLF